ncbi:MAG: aldo/keto reductase [Kiritimatiellia bacterium]
MTAVASNTYAGSRLALGTVQFGLNYGATNTRGRPEYPEILAILQTAIEGGITHFDTAASYGNSEEILGKALRELGVLHHVTLVTKVKHLTGDDGQNKTAIEQSLKQSRIHLGLDQLPLVLFHREEDARYMDFLETFCERGWVHQLGVSCGTDAGADSTPAEDSRVRAIQIPFNALDRRHETSGLLELSRKRGIHVYARSAFLQGLLAVPEAQIPSYCRAVMPAHRHLTSLAREYGMSLAELALRFVLSVPGIHHALVGVDTATQLRENLRMAAAGPLPAKLMLALQNDLPNVPEDILNPVRWPMLSKQETESTPARARSKRGVD